ncbi:MAG: HIT domain-containing protein [bacterium]
MVQVLFPRNAYAKHLTCLKNSCAFCTEGGELLIKRFQYWDWIYSKFPYRKFHTLLIPKRHITRFEELQTEELFELSSILKEVEHRYIDAHIVSEDSVYGDQMYFCWRSRFVPKEKKSVEHFHLHICPKFEIQQGIILEDDAWDIEIGVL